MTEEVKRKPGRPKKNPEEPKEVVEEVVVDAEKENLKKEIEELRRMIVSMNNQTPIKEADDSEKINQDDYIKVIALCPMQLNLSTLPGGKGKIFRFRDFGETKSIVYSALADIIENHQSFLEQGYFYIADKRVIRRHGLDDIYDKILSKEKMEELIISKAEHAVDLFNSASPRQQDFICTMLIKKMYDGEELDLNMVASISRASGIDIVEKAEDAKKFAAAE